MIELGKQPTEVPRMYVSSAVPQGRVCVYEADAGAGAPTSQLVDGLKVVLSANGGKRELKTLAHATGLGEVPGAFLSEADYESFSGQLEHPTLRLYGLSDTWRKVKSRRGFVLLVTTGLGLLLALFGACLAIWGESPTSTAAVAERAQALLRWTTEPVDGPDGPAAVAEREARAQRCLTALRGGEAKVEKVGGVSCETTSPSFFRNKDSGALAAALAGAITALLSLFGLADKFRFGQEPS